MGFYGQFLKRMFDVAAVVLVTPIAAPVALVVAMCIRHSMNRWALGQLLTNT